MQTFPTAEKLILIHMHDITSSQCLLYLIVAAGPEEGRVHDCSDKAAASWREVSLWKGICAAAFRLPQCIASLCGVVAEQTGRER